METACEGEIGDVEGEKRKINAGLGKAKRTQY